MTTLISPHHSTPKASINAFGVPFLLAPTGKTYQWQMIIHCCRVVNGIKNHSPFHGEKPLTIKWILERRSYQIHQTILHGRDAILSVRVKWLIFNIVSRLWADVKYHVPTGFGFSPKTSGFCPFVDATDLDRCEALASAKGCFLCFCFWFHPVIFYWTGKIGEKRWVSVQ